MSEVTDVLGLSRFSVNGNEYTLLEDHQKALLWKAESPGGTLFYEVWVRRYTKKEYKFPNGSVIPAGSLLKPSNEQFGTYAWCYYSLDKAIFMFDQLINEI